MSTSLKAFVYNWLQNAHKLLLPPTCLVCHLDSGTSSFLCKRCESELSEHVPRCRQCALPLLMTESIICGQCLAGSPPWSMSVTAFTYDMPVSGLIHQFKDAGRLTAGRLLSCRLGDEVLRTYTGSTKPDLLLPVPLHPSRMRARGFNQSLEICRHLGKQTGIPFHTHVLTCCRKTASQKELSRQDRRRNLKGAFSVSKKTQAFIANQCIALVDDVMTTGSTANEISRLLLRSGAREVHIWTLARTDRH